MPQTARPAVASRPATAPQMFAPPRPAYADMDLSGGKYGDVTGVNTPYGDPALLAAAYGQPTAAPVSAAAPSAPWTMPQSMVSLDSPAAQGAGLAAAYGGAPAPVPTQAAQNASIVANSPVAQAAGAITGPTSAPAPARAPDAIDPAAVVKQQVPASAGPAPGAGTVPGSMGGPVRTSWVDSTAPGIRPRIEGAQKDELEATEQASKAAVASNDAAAEGHGGIAATLAQSAKEKEALANAYGQDAQAKMDKRDELARDAAKAGADYGWHPSTGTRIAYGIAGALGAMGASLSKGPDFVGASIKDTIDRDLERQKTAIEAKKGRVADMDSALAAAYRKYGNMKDAMDAAASVKLQQVQEQMAQHVAASNSPAVAAQGKIGLAQLKQKQAEVDASLQQRLVTGGGGASSAAAYQKYVDGELSKPGGRAMTYPEFLQARSGAGGASLAGPAGAGKVSPRIQTRLADLDEQDRAAAKLDALLSRGSSLSPSDRARATALAETLRRGGHQSVPENPLQTFDNTTARSAGLGEVRAEISGQRKALEERAAKGGGGGDERDTEDEK